MNILVTGGCGFIGSNFARFILKERPEHKITVLDSFTYAGKIKNVKDIAEKISLVRGSITDKKKAERALKGADAVINFAAETHVDSSIKNPEAFVKTNVFGVFNLLEAARKADVKFVQISTDEVYGSRPAGSFKEEDALRPSNPYSATKAAGEHLVVSYATTYGLPAVITRCSNNFGPYQNTEKFIPKAITCAIKNKSIPVYGSGRNVRDWIYVEDHCSGVLAALEKGNAGEAYNIAGETEKTNIEIAGAILKILGRPRTLIKFVRDRPGHDFRYSMDCAKIKKLGWERKYGLEEGLRRTVDWYMKNKNFWWRAA